MGKIASLNAWIGPLIFVAGAAYLYYAYTQKKFPFDGSIMFPTTMMPQAMTMMAPAVMMDPNASPFGQNVDVAPPADVMELTRLTTDSTPVNIGGTGASNQKSSPIPAIGTDPTMLMSPVVLGADGKPIVVNPPAVMPTVGMQPVPTMPSIFDFFQNIITALLPRPQTMPVTTPGPAPPPSAPAPMVNPLNPNAPPPPGYTLIPASNVPGQVSIPAQIVPTNTLPPMMMTMVVLPPPAPMMAAPPPVMMPVMQAMTPPVYIPPAMMAPPAMMIPSNCPPPPDPPHCDSSGYPSCTSIGMINGRCHPVTPCPQGHSANYCAGWRLGSGG